MSDFRKALEDALRALDKVQTVMPSEARALHEAKQALEKALDKPGVWEWILRKIKNQ